MAVSRWVLFVALFAALFTVVGCSEPARTGTQPPKEDWRDKKQLAEIRVRAEVIKDRLLGLQRELDARDPQKSRASESGEKGGRTHENYLSDPTYKGLHSELIALVESHNSILDQNPSWTMPRLDAKLE